MTIVEGPVLSYFYSLVDFSWILILRFCAIVYMSPLFSIPSLLLGMVGGWLGQVYIIAQLSVKREMSHARAPILGHFGAAAAGIGMSVLSDDAPITKVFYSLY